VPGAAGMVAPPERGLCKGAISPFHRVWGSGPAVFFLYVNPIIVGWTQGWGADPKMVGEPTHGFVHGFCTWFWA